MTAAAALQLAQERGLDLLEIAPTARPPVVRILDYGKFKYEQAKRENEGRKKQSRVVLREVKMRPNIGAHDTDFKTRTAAKLLRAGDKVKITVMFRGREITHPDIGRGRIIAMMERLEAEGIPLIVEKSVSMEGRFMSVIVAADKTKAAVLDRQRQRAADQDSGEDGAAARAPDTAPETASEASSEAAPLPPSEERAVG